MTMGEFRKETEHVPDWWPVNIANEQQQLFDIKDYVVAPELGDRLVLIPEDYPRRK